MEIAPDVHAVRLLGAFGFLVTEERLTLIDAGLPGSRRRLLAYLDGIGRSIEELDRIVCTHWHPDHAGGARELAALSGAEVLMHPADLAALDVDLKSAVTSRATWPLVAFFTRGPTRASAVQDGDVLPALGGLEVVHTPGHTGGSICLWAPRRRIVFTGDTLQVIRGRLTFASPIFSDNAQLARASVRRLAALDIETIALGHYPPWRDDARGTLAQLARASDGPGGRPT